MKIGVVTFPGSLDDADARRAAAVAGAEPVALWHGDADLHGVDAVVQRTREGDDPDLHCASPSTCKV